MSVDILSDVLRAVRLTGAVFFDIDARAPWVAEAPAGSELAPFIMPRAQHVIEYHLLTKGSCHAALVDGASTELSEGDLIVFPQGDPHVLSSVPGARCPPDFSAYERPPGTQLPIRLKEGGNGEPIGVICGFLGCDAHPFNPLLSTLPRTLIVRKSEVAERHLSALPSLVPLIELAVTESKMRRAGSECTLARLSELLFIEAIRAFVGKLPPEHGGWLAGLRDPHVGKALSSLHECPAHTWNVDKLCREVGLSKSVLIERFTRFTGLAPMQYLAQWRMQLAAERLRSTNEGLAEIAQSVGYGSESAFSRAFKRLVGVAPATFRHSGNLPASAQLSRSLA